jgi:hypothetical protein
MATNPCGYEIDDDCTEQVIVSSDGKYGVRRTYGTEVVIGSATQDPRYITPLGPFSDVATVAVASDGPTGLNSTWFQNDDGYAEYTNDTCVRRRVIITHWHGTMVTQTFGNVAAGLGMVNSAWVNAVLSYQTNPAIIAGIEPMGGFGAAMHEHSSTGQWFSTTIVLNPGDVLRAQTRVYAEVTGGLEVLLPGQTLGLLYGSSVNFQITDERI